MFDLELAEKAVIASLVLSLLLGIGVVLHDKSKPRGQIRLEKFGSCPGPAQAVMDRAARIDINTAGPKDLASLDGIGGVLAQRIVDHRSSRGRFSSAEDIRNVRGIGPVLYDKIKDRITVR